MNIDDPIADAITRIRNANEINKEATDIPHSNVKEGVVDVLKEEGYITDYRIYEKQVRPGKEPHKVIRVFLKYTDRGESIIKNIERVSKPGRREYSGVDDLPDVLDGLGVMVVSTPKGVMSDRECRKLQLGGELLCKVW